MLHGSRRDPLTFATGVSKTLEFLSKLNLLKRDDVLPRHRSDCRVETHPNVSVLCIVCHSGHLTMVSSSWLEEAGTEMSDVFIVMYKLREQ